MNCLCLTQTDEEDVNIKYVSCNPFSKSFQKPFLLCPWSVKLAIRKYSTDFSPMVPPMEFLFTLWYPKGSKNNYKAPMQKMANFTLHGHSRNGI